MGGWDRWPVENVNVGGVRGNDLKMRIINIIKQSHLFEDDALLHFGLLWPVLDRSKRMDLISP